MLNLNEIYFGNCLDVMKDIDDKSIDMILADLPFGSTNCQWDSQINLDELWIQYERIIKDHGAIALFAQTPFDKVLGCSNLKLLTEKLIEANPLNLHDSEKELFYKKNIRVYLFFYLRSSVAILLPPALLD